MGTQTEADKVRSRRVEAFGGRCGVRSAGRDYVPVGPGAAIYLGYRRGGQMRMAGIDSNTE
jgi:hypothetical protein